MAEPAFLAVDPDNPQFPALYAKRLAEAIIANGDFPTPEVVQQQIETALAGITPDEVTDATMAAVAGDPGSLFSGELSDTIDGEVRPIYGQRATDLLRSNAPAFRKPLVSPIVVAPPPGGDDAYFPWVINARDIFGSAAIAKYYMYTSCDHSSGAGGIYLRTAESLIGPWSAPQLVFTFSFGSQTETPAAVFNPTTGLLHLYAQVYTVGVPGFTAGQSTGLATSSDGITFTEVGVVLTTPNQVEVMGAGQLTYFRPFRIGGMWVGYHLYAPGDQFRSGMSFSQDGINWNTDRQQLGSGTEWDVFGGRAIAWHYSSVLLWQGRNWVVGVATEYVSGTGAGSHIIYVAPLSDDMRRLAGAPIPILPVTQPWESDNVRGVYAFVDAGHIHVFYQSNKDGARPSIGYATTEGVVA